MYLKIIGNIILIILVIVVGVIVYFIPSIVAERKQHKHLIPIIAINLFLGLTFAGWLFALVWAIYGPFKNKGESQKTGETASQKEKNLSTDEITQNIMKCKSLFDQGVITQEEFDEMKKKIINS